MIKGNGQNQDSCGFSRCQAPRPLVWTWWTYRRNWTAGCSRDRHERPASVQSAGNSTHSASVRQSLKFKKRSSEVVNFPTAKVLKGKLPRMNCFLLPNQDHANKKSCYNVRVFQRTSAQQSNHLKSPTALKFLPPLALGGCSFGRATYCATEREDM